MGEYPANWKEIANQVKEEAEWVCIRCGHSHDPEAGYCLTVHHLDMNKANCYWWNLAALCQRCHLRIQAKVVVSRIWMFEHSEWFKPYVAGRYMYLMGLPQASEWRDFITRRADAIISTYLQLEAIEVKSRITLKKAKGPKI